MSRTIAELLIDDLRDVGVTLSANGDRIRVEAPEGVLTEALRARIARHKPELLRLLSLPAYCNAWDRLAEACRRQGIDPAPVLVVAEVDDLDHLPEPTVEAYARALRDRLCRERGEVPPGWHQAAACRRCGPVLLRADWASPVENCPWCFNRLKGLPIPRPDQESHR